ncbi:MAG: phage tail tape measure protein, partial [Oxalobacter sp.]|nr:phage tail tape measure protein [Oxalobacter sp.]
IMADNVAGDLKNLESAWEELGISVFDSQNSGLRGSLQWLTEITRDVGLWAKENPKLVETLGKVAAILAILITAGGVLLLLVSTILAPLAMLKLVLAGVAISAGAVTWPILAIIAAVALLAAGIYLYWDEIKALFTGIENFLSTLVPKFFQFGADMVNGLIDGIISMAKKALDKIKSFAGSIAEAFQAAMGIHSPSRVFMGYGGHMTEGLAIGINRGQNQPLQQVRALTDQLGRISSDIIFDQKTGEGIRIDRRPPMAVSGAGGTASVGETKIEIIINPQPGSDPQAIARAVALELDRREREKAVRRSAGYVDY